ncbi:MAG: hypothetical protein QG610_1302, partial [Euryarchaeota archaeon]|nr:hypothetical protein [Euryarchaeota archaeon]
SSDLFFDYTVLGSSVHSGMLIGCFFILAAAVVISLDNSVFLRKLIFGDKMISSKKVPFWKREFLRPQGK